ncbi:MAG: multifunctional oxoglutarate decarboxylase/oxoglutarate dehydrogenase thiamine pyrophosphate-binding subunit/dihydrolipoyllysine-residue succinyltransferase subunit [Deltaproteobacteria bacterium]|nr:multifunctional oxoglutarate decarboxylase/oxoglutarate dehydrogenase thiamine pyrophosphate-binding subunit/dihydrolipoyllysine-residue succinyltransferase subunit [Deltaproteobacteria bacterium]
MTSLGSNLGFVDELYARFKADPASVSAAWQDFFADYAPPPGRPVPAVAPPSSPSEDEPRPVAKEASEAKEHPAAAAPEGATELVGAAARIAANMEASLAVPTATSARAIPVKLLEENRRIINDHQAATSGLKVSFTHLIAWAIVRALEKHPAMNAEYVAQAERRYLRQRPAVNLGLAIDVERKGERSLVVPNIKDVGRLRFPDFVSKHDALVAAARQGKLAVDDLTGTTVSITNPGMLGTAMSVPRLMATQGAVFGVGRIGYPPELAGMSPKVISELGLSKVMTVTSTYDHRVIQGAESGAFLGTLERLLLGDDAFYSRIFKELSVPHEPLVWAPDENPSVASQGGGYEGIEKQASVLQLIRAFRVRGHLLADLNPLGYSPQPQPELELSTYGLSLWDLDREFVAGGVGGKPGRLPLREILEVLRQTYCRHVGVEYMHVPEPEVRDWLQARTERTQMAAAFDAAARQRVIDKLNAAEAFERFLHTTYVGQKRFSLEGAESVIPLLDQLLSDAVQAGFEEAVIGMSHRGRLNVLANVVGKSVGDIFREFEGEIDPRLSHGSGDVKYHVGASGTHRAPSGATLKVHLASNPSHLEAVDPVVVGMVRARQDLLADWERARVLPILLHGDAAFSGQGVVAETLNLSLLHGYRVGGTIHVVINNQIGFTTGPEHLRSSLYATDVAKAVRAPIFHVNGDYPEAVLAVGKLALEFRRAFRRDVLIDLVCYRRFGHNEGDDPSYTQPTLYAQIKNHRSVRKLYTEQLLRRGDLPPASAEKSLDAFQEKLRDAHAEVMHVVSVAGAAAPIAAEAPGAEAAAAPEVPTAVARATLTEVMDGLGRVPAGFEVHAKLASQLVRRRERFDAGSVDWATAEALAFGSLTLQGKAVRLSGEDSGRGTFSQRHAVLYDATRGDAYVPLAHLAPTQGAFRVYDSQLSEFAVLGFEYGYSVNAPGTLVLWEAQFGDFANGAQVVVDQFLASAEAKWGQPCGVVMLLPHGYEGQGPEHSSARIERFLQLCADGMMRVVYPSSPAQYFHLLRFQALAHERKPLVVFTPKSLLRHPRAVSSVDDLGGGRFESVLETVGDPEPQRLVICCGKVYYDLIAKDPAAAAPQVALLRVEQLYPWPRLRLQGLLRRFATAHDVVWVQEEPENMGAWRFARVELQAALCPGQTLRYVGRQASASTATGSQKRHQAEQEQLVREALSGP